MHMYIKAIFVILSNQFHDILHKYKQQKYTISYFIIRFSSKHTHAEICKQKKPLEFKSEEIMITKVKGSCFSQYL